MAVDPISLSIITGIASSAIYTGVEVAALKLARKLTDDEEKELHAVYARAFKTSLSPLFSNLEDKLLRDHTKDILEKFVMDEAISQAIIVMALDGQLPDVTEMERWFQNNEYDLTSLPIIPREFIEKLLLNLANELQRSAAHDGSKLKSLVTIGMMKQILERQIKLAQSLTSQTVSNASPQSESLFLADQTPGGGLRKFVGRSQELDEIVTLLKLSDSNQNIVAIHAGAGVGKTMLVSAVSRKIRRDYPGGILFEHRGQKTLRNPQTIFRSWARLLGYEIENGQLISSNEMRGWLEFAGRLLFIFDDVWPEDNLNLRELLAALPVNSSCIIITRNEAYAQILGARLYLLNVLSIDDSVLLLQDRLDINHDETILRTLSKTLDGHPLALELATGRYRRVKDLVPYIEKLDRKLRDGDFSEIATQIPGLHVEKDDSLIVSLEETISALREIDFDIVNRFALLGTFAPDANFDFIHVLNVFNYDDIWSDEEVSREKTKQTIDVLLDYGLLNELEVDYGIDHPAAGMKSVSRYTQHVVIRAYALALLKKGGIWHAAQQKHLEFCYVILHTARHTPIVMDLEIEQFRHAFAWASDHQPEQLFTFVDATWQHLLVRNYLEDARLWLDTLFIVSEAKLNLLGKGLALKGLGRLLVLQFDYGQAIEKYRQSFEAYQEAGNNIGYANTLRALGEVLTLQGRLGQAQATLEKAARLYFEENEILGLANVYSNLGDIMSRRGEFEIAKEYFEESMIGYVELENYYSATGVGLQLAGIAFVQKDFVNARRQCEGLLNMLRLYDNKSGQIQALIQLSFIEIFDLNVDKAKQLLNQVIEVASHPVLPVTDKMMGQLAQCELCILEGKYREAIKIIWELIQFFGKLNAPYAENTIQTMTQQIASVLRKDFTSVWEEITDHQIPTWLKYDEKAPSLLDMGTLINLISLDTNEREEYLNAHPDIREKFEQEPLYRTNQMAKDKDKTVEELVMDLVQIPQNEWDRKQQYITIHSSVLLSDATVIYIQEAIERQEELLAVKMFAYHLDLIKQCRAIGIGNAFMIFRKRSQNNDQIRLKTYEVISELIVATTPQEMMQIFAHNIAIMENPDTLIICELMVAAMLKEGKREIAQRIWQIRTAIESVQLDDQ